MRHTHTTRLLAISLSFPMLASALHGVDGATLMHRFMAQICDEITAATRIYQESVAFPKPQLVTPSRLDALSSQPLSDISTLSPSLPVVTSISHVTPLAAPPPVGAPAKLTIPALNPSSSQFTTHKLHLPKSPPGATQPRTVLLPKAPSGAFAHLVACRLIYAGLLDGSLNPRSPLWRPELTSLLAHRSTSTAERELLFTLILAGCPGADDHARITAAEKWAADHEEGRYASTIGLAAAHHSFNSGAYDATIARCNLLLTDKHPAPDQLLALRALAEAYSGKTEQARATIGELRQNHPDSATQPETFFMEAWLALQQNDTATAARLFRHIITSYPRSATASRAATALYSIQPQTSGGHL